MVAAVERALRDGHNGYAPSVGILAAREAVTAECIQRGMPMSPDRVVITSGTSEGIELALTALAGPGDEVLIPVPTYPLYTAVLAKIGAKAVFYRTDPARGWEPDVDHVRSSITPKTRALVIIDPNNPTGAEYSDEARRALVDLAESHNIPAARRRGLRRSRVRRPRRRAGRAQPRRAGDHVLVGLEGVPRAGLAIGMDGGSGHRPAGRRAGRGEEAGRRTAVLVRTDGARARRRAHGRSVAPAGLPRRAAGARGDHRRPAERDRRHQRGRAGSGLLRDAESGASRRRHRRGLRARRSCAPPACCASTDPGSARRRKTATSGSCSSPRRRSSRTSTGSSTDSRASSSRADVSRWPPSLRSPSHSSCTPSG